MQLKYLPITLVLVVAIPVLADRWPDGGNNVNNQVRVVSSVTTTLDTAANVTGLAMPARANVPMWFRCKLAVSTTTATSKVRFDISGPASVVVRWANESYDTTTAKVFEIQTSLGVLSTAGNTPTSVTFTTLEGILRPTAVGTYQVRFASETAGETSTVETASVCEYGYEY